MVWNPEHKEVDVKRMMIYSVIPFLNVYSHWRIQKFWAINLLLFPFAIMNQLALAYTEKHTPESDIFLFLGLFITIVTLALGVLLTRYFALKYNLTVQDTTTED